MKKAILSLFAASILASGAAMAIKWECTDCTLYPDGRIVCKHCVGTDGATTSRAPN
ncbi:hypothetical protein [Xenophilus sp.]|jgi:hypothetical protein|uniref:hypothetical protein n=1 Tax=Xenophilus sp. TaxID=1873499 RepID=UPI0037DD4F5C